MESTVKCSTAQNVSILLYKIGLKTKLTYYGSISNASGGGDVGLQHPLKSQILYTQW